MWIQIGKMLHVSRSTIHRRVRDHGMEHLSKFSETTDADLDSLAQDYLSRHGPTTGKRPYAI